MSYQARVITDSLNQEERRLTTFLLTYPRFVHSEFLTHRSHSRNTSSSRAIPVSVSIAEVQNEPVLPLVWGKRRVGMIAGDAIPLDDQEKAEKVWLEARDAMVRFAKDLDALHVHKSWSNRLLEPFKWVTVITSAMDDGWQNFFELRCAPDAQPELRKIAEMTRSLYQESAPKVLADGDWHLPFADPTLPTESQIVQSVCACARVSYQRQNEPVDQEEGRDFMKRLWTARHFSPFEHQAVASRRTKRSGNLQGFIQLRHSLFVF